MSTTKFLLSILIAALGLGASAPAALAVNSGTWPYYSGSFPHGVWEDQFATHYYNGGYPNWQYSLYYPYGYLRQTYYYHYYPYTYGVPRYRR